MVAAHGSTESSEAAHLAYAVFLILHHVLERFSQLSELKNAKPCGQIDSRTHYEYDQRDAPDQVVNRY